MLRHREINREKAMTAGGTWELGVRSDLSGGTEPNSKQSGEIMSVNVWNRVLRRNEIEKIMASCVSNYKGNVKSWQDFKSGFKENVEIVKSSCCKI